jgi:hypothetical protein
MSTDRTAAERQRRRRAMQKTVAELRFTRADWALFLDPTRLAQKAGAPVRLLRCMALKELADNAADVSSEVEVVQLGPDTYRVADRGPGMDRAQVVELFAVNRPLTSSKLLRRPTRGAIGNGLRVVIGAAIGSRGELAVESRGRRWRLGVDRTTGSTQVLADEPSACTWGTTVTVRFGPALPSTADDLVWARTAARLAGPAARPMLSHPGWYSASAWDELTGAADGATASQLLATAFGIHVEDDRPARDLSLVEAVTLAEALPEPKLVALDAEAFGGDHVAVRGEAQDGLPVLVQAWAQAERVAGRGKGSVQVELLLNRTPTASEMFGGFQANEAYLQGCRICHILPGVHRANYDVRLAITSPLIPMVTDGKEPDLLGFVEPIVEAAAAAMRKSFRKSGSVTGVTLREAAFDVMADAYMRASASNTLPANARQIYYAARPYVLQMTGKDKLDSNYFTQVLLPDYLDANPAETADWDVVFDARGHLTEPHTGDIIPLGTVDVRRYLRPRSRTDTPLVQLSGGLWKGRLTDRYRTVLFLEKEGFGALIEAARIRERFDVAVMSTKGMSVTAARTLVARLSGDGMKILVARDLDRSGFSIFGTLAGDTRRFRYDTAPDVVDLGLRLDEAREMGLQDEEAPLQNDRDRVANTLRAHGATEAEIGFLVDDARRVELNAMTSDVFVDWLTSKLETHGSGKVVPDVQVLEAAWRHHVARQHVLVAIRDAEAQAAAYTAKLDVPPNLVEQVHARTAGTAQSWDEAIEQIVSRSRAD